MNRTLRLLVVTAVLAAIASARAHAAPLYGTWGYDLTARDTTVRAGDDFFRYANGGWLTRTEIPGDKAGVSLRLLMSNLTEARLHDLCDENAATAEHAPTTLAGKVGAYYKAFMDSARIDQAGVTPLADDLAAIRGCKTREDIAVLMGQANGSFGGTLFGVFTDVDVKDPTRYAVYVSQAGLGLPDRDYYLDASFAEKKAKYEAYVAKLLGLAKWPDADARAKDVVAYETAVAAASWTRTQQRDPDATYNPMTVAELNKNAPGFAWREYLAAAHVDKTDRYVIAEKTAFPKLTALFAKTPLATLQAWEAFNVLDNASPYLASDFYGAWFDLHGATLSGQKVASVRWKRGVHAVAGGDFLGGDRFDRFGNLGWGVGQLYADKWFPPSAKAAIQQLVLNLKAAYRVRLEKLDWMSPATRTKALEKLDTYTIKVGYPDHPRDYSTLLIRDDDPVGNARRAGALEWAFYANRLGGPVDHDEWGMTPQTNDAYNGSLRDIVFPAGILQPPIFDADADPAVNYGAAGGVIGHELTHGFDDEGRKFDAQGRLADWWAPSDAKTFETRASHLGAQYSAFEPLPGVKVNGALTMGENIADLGGITLALEAYHASLGGKAAPLLDGLTGDQRVFLGWAQAWCGKSRDDAIKRQVVSDPHSPRIFRVNGVVRNVDAWYEAFGVKPGEKLYVAPGDRVRIW